MTSSRQAVDEKVSFQHRYIHKILIFPFIAYSWLTNPFKIFMAYCTMTSIYCYLKGIRGVLS